MLPYNYYYALLQTIEPKFSIYSQSDEIFSNTFDNPMYGSVGPKKDYNLKNHGITLGNYVLRTNSFSEVDDEGYLEVSKGKLSFDESEDDRIYEEIKT